jgi:hypothetical protein
MYTARQTLECRIAHQVQTIAKGLHHTNRAYTHISQKKKVVGGGTSAPLNL